MDDRGMELRAALEQIRVGRTRWRCPAGLRSEVVGYVGERRSKGERIGRIAWDLGLSEPTLIRWGQAASGRFREVQVADPAMTSSVLCLVTPRGYRLEGLTERQAIRILREF